VYNQAVVPILTKQFEIRFELTDNLDLYFPDGRKFMSTLELENLRINTEYKLKKEKHRADKEQKRADKEKQRADLL